MYIPAILYAHNAVNIAIADCSNSTIRWHYFEVKKQRGEFNVNSCEPNDFNKNTPILLLLQGGEIITKISAANEDPFTGIIPQHRQSEFIRTEASCGLQKIVCFALSSTIENTIAELKEKPVHTDFCSVYALNGLTLLNQENIAVNIPCAEISIVKFTPALRYADSPENQMFLGDTYATPKLTALLSGIYFLSRQVSLKTKYPDELEYAFFKRAAMRFYGLLLCVIFAVLLFNYTRYSTLQHKYPLAESEISSLKVRIAAAKAKIKSAGSYNFSRNSCLSQFSDRIGRIVPSGVTLTNMAFAPINGQVESGDITSINQNSLEITGTSLSSSDVNLLMDKLKSESWISTLSLADLSFSADNSRYNFTLTAKLK